MLNIRYTKSKGIKTKKNHIILFANVEGKAESRLIEKAIKKAAREIRKTLAAGRLSRFTSIVEIVAYRGLISTDSGGGPCKWSIAQKERR